MIVPSIDIQNGRAVQLRQGTDLLFEDPRDPVELAREFGRYGEVAVIDLDAALGRGSNEELIRACCQVADCRVGGGIRSEDRVRYWIRRGACKVIVGTMATPEFLAPFPRDWIVGALDARGDDVVVEGWTTPARDKVVDRARRLAEFCGEFLFTQVDVEGTLAGPDLATASILKRTVECPITVAGGIRNIDDVRALEDLGCNSQIGRALYEEKIDLGHAWTELICFDDKGLVPTIVQDDATGAMLMLAFSTSESLSRALRSGRGWYYSRSRDQLWEKGATSGNRQNLLAARWDCDRDAVLFRVEQTGPACHRGLQTCFGQQRSAPLAQLESDLRQRETDEANARSYTRKLLSDPLLLAAKLREEIEEVISAPDDANLTWECADVIYHLMVKMRSRGICLSEVVRELRCRTRN